MIDRKSESGGGRERDPCLKQRRGMSEGDKSWDYSEEESAGGDRKMNFDCSHGCRAQAGKLISV